MTKLVKYPRSLIRSQIFGNPNTNRMHKVYNNLWFILFGNDVKFCSCELYIFPTRWIVSMITDSLLRIFGSRGRGSRVYNWWHVSRLRVIIERRNTFFFLHETSRITSSVSWGIGFSDKGLVRRKLRGHRGLPTRISPGIVGIRSSQV